MLQSLKLVGVGPAPEMEMQFAPRLNVLTGDNGLGKSFVLDVVWWALTQTWVQHPALPREDFAGEPKIIAKIVGDFSGRHTVGGEFDFVQQSWSNWAAGNFTGVSNRAAISEHPWQVGCPVLYARSDGSFGVWDPFRNYRNQSQQGRNALLIPDAYRFDSKSLWYDLRDGDKILCNGLVADWVSWQQEDAAKEPGSPFSILCRVLETLSPPNETLKPGKPRRVFADDARKYPTLDLPYENIPIVLASAGMQRILSFAYALTWTWVEHLEASRLVRREPTKNLVVLIDEVENHLHPEWQRRILPAILRVLESLGDGMQVQMHVTTHSPLVLASLEPHWDDKRDQLFHFALKDRKVVLDSEELGRWGTASRWLKSRVFGLSADRSIEAERAMDDANAFMRGDEPKYFKTPEEVDKELKRTLPGQDPFWPRWLIFMGDADK